MATTTPRRTTGGGKGKGQLPPAEISDAKRKVLDRLYKRAKPIKVNPARAL
jgi:hypothetical protein